MPPRLPTAARATLSRPPIASPLRRARAAPQPSALVRLASTGSYYGAPPAEKKGIRIGTLFLGLAAVGLGATSIGLYSFYSSYTAYPNTTSHPIRTLLRRALTAAGNGDQPRAATAFEAAYSLALDLESRGELDLMRTTGIAIRWGGMWEQVGQISKAREAYELAWNEVVERTKTGAATTDEVLRGVAVALKIGDLWVEEKVDSEAERYFVWSIEEMMRLGMTDEQKQTVLEEMTHDAVPAKVQRTAESGAKKAEDDGWDLPKWLGKVELVAGFERLGDLYSRTGKPESVLQSCLLSSSHLW